MSFEGKLDTPQAVGSEGKTPNCSVWVKIDTLKALSRIRTKMLIQKDFEGRVTYNDVIVELLSYYDGEFS